MIVPAPNTNSSAGGVTETVAVAGTTAQFTTALVLGQWYWLAADTDLWFAQGTNPTAAKAASTSNGSAFLAKGDRVMIDGACGAKLAVIQGSAAGFASLTVVRIGR